MIKVAWLSSYSTKCGIAEYSSYLVNALRKRGDVDVKVFSSKNYGDYNVEEQPPYCDPTFAVPLWNGGIDDSFDYEKILAWKPDIVHIQYEVVLYNAQKLSEFLQEYKGPVVITYHDNCIPPDLLVSRFNLQYSHREGVGVGSGYLIPMGVENRKPVVKTFGLGRSRKDIIQEVCDNLGYDFEYSFGEDKWVSQEELYEWLRDSDAIVLYYDDAPAAGVSIAARVAISTRRPVIVNDVTWFKGLAEESTSVWVVQSPDDLQWLLEDQLGNPYIEENSWDSIAQMHVEDYRTLL